MDDTIYLLGAFAGLVVFFVALSMAYEPTYDVLYNGLNSSAVQTALNNVSPAAFTNWLDVAAIVVYFVFHILISVVLPLSVRHNILAISSIFLFSFIYPVIVAVVSNSIVEFVQSTGVSFPFTMFVLNSWVLFEIIFILTMAIIMFFKLRGGVENQQYGYE